MNEHTVVLVTGSMRSGTSSLAGSLKTLGWHVPQPEVPASPRNSKGHFEPRWVIEFHKRLMRGALVRPSDGSPRAVERVAALLQDGAVVAELRDWLVDQPETRVVVKDPHAAWVLPTWRAAATAAGRDLMVLTALRHPAEVVGSQDITWGQGRRTDAERRVKETSNVAAWLNLALVTERSSRDMPRAFLRYDALLADWRATLARTSSQLELDLDLDGAAVELDAFLDPGLRRSQLSWDDLVLPDWLRALAQDAWDQLAELVNDPGATAPTGLLDEIRTEYDARYAEAVAVSLDEARHRERRGSAAGAAKLRDRLRSERQRRRTAEARLAEAGTDGPARPGSTDGRRGQRHQVGASGKALVRRRTGGPSSVDNAAGALSWWRWVGGHWYVQAQRTKRALGQISRRSRSGNRSATNR